MSALEVPALVVSGFLGSGKTTLVRQLLEDAQRNQIRVAVISNEFGALGIDQALLGTEGRSYVELEGGCVCCQLSDELIDTLEMLRVQVRPDRVIVETSGLALPADVQLSFWREPVCEWIVDDVAVVVVDAEQVLQRRDLTATFETQVSSADILLLNKIDLVPAEALGSIEAWLREIEPEAPLLRTTHAQIDSEVFFPSSPARAGERRREPRPAHAPHVHEAFESCELEIEAGISEADLRERLGAGAPVRVKGFVRTEDGVRLVQGVGPRLEISELREPPPRALIGRVVVIRRTGSS